MMLTKALLAIGGIFLLLSFIFVPLEKAFPAKEQHIFRPHWWTDLAFFLGQYLFWTSAVFLLLHPLQGWLDRVTPHGFRAAVAAQPWLLQSAEVILLSDLLIYWGHRIQHRVEFLWRFHAIHHSPEHLDWLATYREHPIDTIYTVGLINLPAFALGFPISSIAFLLAFRGIWAVYVHSNARLPIGPLRYLIGAPELHHWHHSKERFGGNYANLSPLMDLVFGTYHHPPGQPSEYGVAEEMPRGYWGQLLHPFRRRKTRRQADASAGSAPT